MDSVNSNFESLAMKGGSRGGGTRSAPAPRQTQPRQSQPAQQQPQGSGPTIHIDPTINLPGSNPSPSNPPAPQQQEQSEISRETTTGQAPNSAGPNFQNAFVA